MENNEQKQIVNKRIEDIDISDIDSITLIPNNYKKIQIKTKNFYKIVKLIIINTGKTEFYEDELLSIYNRIIENYQTSLDTRTYSKIKEVLSIFVKNGGKIDIKYITKDSDLESNFNKEDKQNEVVVENIKNKKDPSILLKGIVALFLLFIILIGIFGVFCGAMFSGTRYLTYVGGGLFVFLGFLFLIFGYLGSKLLISGNKMFLNIMSNIILFLFLFYVIYDLIFVVINIFFKN